MTASEPVGEAVPRQGTVQEQVAKVLGMARSAWNPEQSAAVLADAGLLQDDHWRRAWGWACEREQFWSQRCAAAEAERDRAVQQRDESLANLDARTRAHDKTVADLVEVREQLAHTNDLRRRELAERDGLRNGIESEKLIEDVYRVMLHASADVDRRELARVAVVALRALLAPVGSHETEPET